VKSVQSVVQDPCCLLCRPKIPHKNPKVKQNLPSEIFFTISQGSPRSSFALTGLQDMRNRKDAQRAAAESAAPAAHYLTG